MKGKLIGYARVSSSDQELNIQVNALIQAGCKKKDIYSDLATRAKSARPGLEDCLNALANGDTLIVWRLDRLGRSIHHLIAVIEELHQRGIGFRSLSDGPIDTTSARGEQVFHVFSSLAQFERQLIQERTQTGLTAARVRNRKGGRKPTSADDPKVRLVKKMSQNTSISIGDICKTLNISRATYYRYLSVIE
jgi:DNA invertase Pin-like site-specific DNA recombinase